eukprot:1591624-Pleurochrysis_carterae.AAC.1
MHACTFWKAHKCARSSEGALDAGVCPLPAVLAAHFATMGALALVAVNLALCVCIACRSCER